MEPILHFLIPLLILLVLYPKIDKRLAIGLALLAVIPDVDYFIDFTHRYLFHNIFFPIILASIIYFFTKNLQATLISFYYLMSHLILDFATGGVALFWPFYNKLIYVATSLTTEWVFKFSIGTASLTKVKDYMVTYPSYYFTEIGILTLFVVVIMLIIRYKKEIMKLFKK